MSDDQHQQAEAMKELAGRWVELQPVLLTYIRASVHSFSDAEDVLQAVAKDIVQKYPEYDPSKPMIGWAIWLAKFRIIDFYRKSGRDRHVFGDEVLARIATACVEHEHDLKPRAEALHHCMKKLPTKSLELLEMRYVEDKKPKEIAVAISTSSGTVRVALTRIRKGLAECIDKWLSEEGRLA